MYINNLLFIKIILVWRFFKACRFLCANRRKIEHNKRPKSFSRALLICWTTKWSGFRKYRATGSARKTAIIAKLVKQHRLRILLEGKPATWKMITIINFSSIHAFLVKTGNCRFFAYKRQNSSIYRIKFTLLDPLSSRRWVHKNSLSL